MKLIFPQPRVRIALALLALAPFITGCDQAMRDNSRLRPFEPNQFFADGVPARHPVEGTVPRSAGPLNPALNDGVVNGQPVAEFPIPITRATLERGRDRFNIFCAPCHGLAGFGDGIIPQRGFTRPPSYHMVRLYQAPPGHFFQIATKGIGVMPGYANQVNVEDRWAIVGYIRTLQLSQRAPGSVLTPEEQVRLEAETTP